MERFQKQIEIIKKRLEELLEKMTIIAETEVFADEECPRFAIKVDSAGILIGDKGQGLSALSHILKKITEAEFEKNKLEKIQFSLDINDYQAKKNEELKTLARMSAQRVRYFKKEIELEPMTSYERRIIHATLTEYPDIITESIGISPNRRVVIKPLEDKEAKENDRD